MKKITIAITMLLVSFSCFAEITIMNRAYKTDSYGYLTISAKKQFFNNFENDIAEMSDEDLVAKIVEVNKDKIYVDNYNNKKQYEEAEKYLCDKYGLVESSFNKIRRIIANEVSFRLELAENEENPISFLVEQVRIEEAERAAKEQRVHQAINVFAEYLKQTGDRMGRIGDLYR